MPRILMKRHHCTGYQEAVSDHYSNNKAAFDLNNHI